MSDVNEEEEGEAQIVMLGKEENLYSCSAEYENENNGENTKAAKSGILGLTSEADVEKWLKLTVKLPEKHFKDDCLKQLDADTLMSYVDPEKLCEELHLPKGFARKVIYLKDNPSDRLVGGYTREALENITTDDIVEFVKDSLSKANNTSEIENAIRKECIDGFVMQLYKDHNALSKDLEISTFYARKILIFVKKQIQEKASVSATKIPPSFSAITNDKQSPDDVFFSKMLGLRCLDGYDKNQDLTCQLFGIHNQWTEKNKLGEMFLFWILCKDSLTKQEQNRLWKHITSSIPLWLGTLPDNEKNNFSQGKSENKFIYKGGPPVTLRDSGSVVQSFDTISSDLRDKFKNHILILHNDVSSVTTSPHRLERRTIIAEHGKKMLWVFDKDGIKMVQPSRESNSSADGQSKDEQNWVEQNKDERSKVEHCKGRKNRDHQNKDQQSKEDAYRLEYHGDKKQKYETKANEMVSDVAVSSDSYIHPRRFKQDSSSYVYYKGYLIDLPESGSGMIRVSMEFKLFTTSIGSGKSRQKFLKETLRFACGCLNRRRNGTIYFGVGDNQGRQKEDKYKHGQIVGFPILESDEDSKSVYIDELYKAKSSWFDSPEANAAATECIKDPVFVKVSSTSFKFLYVMEVDVEPSSCFCKGVKFRLDLSHVKGKRQGVYVYVRDSAQTKRLITADEEENFTLKLNHFDESRQYEEKHTSPYNCLPPERHKYLGEKLCRKLSRDERKFYLSFWPILMSNTPTEEMKLWVYKSVNFISHVQWKAVFEFDNESTINGLCSNFFPTSQATYTDVDFFRNNDNVNDLVNTLWIQEKKIVLFCNGRFNIHRDQSKYEWKRSYLPNIKRAINLFQKTSVVPEGRALIVCLLFSSDIEKYTETFGEILTFFGFKQVVLICAERHVYNIFKSAILQQQIMKEKDLENMSIVGMPWDQTNECINKLIGVENPTVTFLPSSSGVLVEVDPAFEESLDTLEMLSSQQCESKIFESIEEKDVFYREKELQFYQGHRVDWWNLFFGNQVMERHCFKRLTMKIHDALRPQKQDMKRVSCIHLRHEPGAGGSTLSRHLLWHFRKECRCAVITKLKEKTASDIVSMWQYKEDRKLAQPLLLLIDSVPEQTIDGDELLQLISNRVLEKDFPPPICVLLICIREVHFNESDLSDDEMMKTDFLPQKVEEKEEEWLSRKIEELEKSSLNRSLTKFKGEYFISFMVLHSNFDKDILRRTVTGLIEGMNFDDKSCKLLMYVALVSAFVSPSNGGPAIAIPIESCSAFMGQSLTVKQNKEKDDDKDDNITSNSLWANELSGPERILLVVEDKKKGSGKQVRMAHQNLAITVLDCAKVVFNNESNTGVVLADIALDFLESDICRTTSYGKAVNRLCIELLTRRKKEEYDDEEMTTFSPLIEKIRSGGKTDIAVRILEKGFRLFQDECIAQQLSRLLGDFGDLDMENKE